MNCRNCKNLKDTGFEGSMFCGFRKDNIKTCKKYVPIIECPNCHKEIDTLRHFQTGEMSYKFWVQNGLPYYEQDEFNEDNKMIEWECPECHKVVAKTEEQATNILKGG